jgi:hypothetical protein
VRQARSAAVARHLTSYVRAYLHVFRRIVVIYKCITPGCGGRRAGAPVSVAAVRWQSNVPRAELAATPERFPLHSTGEALPSSVPVGSILLTGIGRVSCLPSMSSGSSRLDMSTLRCLYACFLPTTRLEELVYLQLPLRSRTQLCFHPPKNFNPNFDQLELSFSPISSPVTTDRLSRALQHF